MCEQAGVRRGTFANGHTVSDQGRVAAGILEVYAAGH